MLQFCPIYYHNKRDLLRILHIWVFNMCVFEWCVACVCVCLSLNVCVYMCDFVGLGVCYYTFTPCIKNHDLFTWCCRSFYFYERLGASPELKYSNITIGWLNQNTLFVVKGNKIRIKNNPFFINPSLLLK